jgi:hypothetical protein
MNALNVVLMNAQGIVRVSFGIYACAMQGTVVS